jgi:hypothetical protein
VVLSDQSAEQLLSMTIYAAIEANRRSFGGAFAMTFALGRDGLRHRIGLTASPVMAKALEIDED